MNNNKPIKIYHNVDELVVKFFKNKERLLELEPNIFIKIGTNKFNTFKRDGICCYNCGIKGQYFALEKDQGNYSNNRRGFIPENRYAMNLYALDKDGNSVLMTHDHVIARSLGGSSNGLNNLKTMCSRCNNRKSSNETHAAKALSRLLMGNSYYEDNLILLYNF